MLSKQENKTHGLALIINPWTNAVYTYDSSILFYKQNNLKYFFLMNK